MLILTRKISLVSGILCGIGFAPTYFLPGILMLSVLCSQISKSKTLTQAVAFGYWFGFGFFLSTLYWISFGIMVYVDEFWWAIPFALFGLPAFLSLFTAFVAFLSWQVRKSSWYHMLFCIFWLFSEWVMSWIFTGFPWSMIGYIFSFSEILLQPLSLIGILGLSFTGVFIGSSFYSKNFILPRILISFTMIAAMCLYGSIRLDSNPTQYSDIKIRIVQPSIPQISKWSPDVFFNNLNQHINLSIKDGTPDIIIWSEAAVTVPFYYQEVYDKLLSVFTKEKQYLLAGGVNDNNMYGDNYEIYSSLIALNNNGELLFDYNKSHLVPFGEYMPLKKYLPLKKLTHGIIDYTPGSKEIVSLSKLNLKILPLICYESIFFDEVRTNNTDADLIINITNDAWYGKSSGPFQHFQISRARAIENGLPLIRVANNGISAIIDSYGRVIGKLKLNEVGILDRNLPYKLSMPTLFSKYGNICSLLFILLVLILQKVLYINITKSTKTKLFLE